MFQFSIALIVGVLSRFIRNSFEIPQESEDWRGGTRGCLNGGGEEVERKESGEGAFCLMAGRKDTGSWMGAGVVIFLAPL